MQLTKYTVKIQISDPQDTETQVEAVFHDCPRESLIALPIISSVLGAFESAIEETR